MRDLANLNREHDDSLVNSNGYCKYCKTKNIHYSIQNGSDTYYCLKCDKELSKQEVLNKFGVK